MPDVDEAPRNPWISGKGAAKSLTGYLLSQFAKVAARCGRGRCLPLTCALDFRLASSRTAGARLRPPRQCAQFSRRESSAPCALLAGESWKSIGRCGLANEKDHAMHDPFRLGTGGYLLFQLVSKPVLSAYKGLTAVFGMGTGGSP